MTGQLTTYGRNRAINAGVGNAEAATSAMYLALATALPASPQTATLGDFDDHEITTGGYDRQAVTWASASGGSIANDGTILFGQFSADPPSVQYAFECDTSSGSTGNVMAYWTLDEAVDANNGDFIQISPTDLVLAIDTCP